MPITDVIFHAYMESYAGITYNHYVDGVPDAYMAMWMIAMGMHDTLDIKGRLMKING